MSSKAAQTAATRRPTSGFMEQGQMRMVETRLMAREAELIDASRIAAGGLSPAGEEGASMSRVVLRCSRMFMAMVTQSKLEFMGLPHSRPRSMASMVLESLLLPLLPLLMFILSSLERVEG